MGLFDRWLGKSKGREEQAPPVAAPSEPQGLLGRITALDSDGVGRIALEDGRELRFGRSGCKGFEPVLNARVLVAALGPHPMGGERATEVHKAPGSDGELDVLQEAQAVALGLMKTDPHARTVEAMRDALTIGKVTALLAQASPSERSAQRAFVASLVPEATELTFDGAAIHFRVENQLVMVVFGFEPFPRSYLNLSDCPELDVGQGFVSFLWDASLLEKFLPSLDEEKASALTARIGGVRAFLADVAERLGARSVGVVLHTEGHRVRPGAQAMAVT
jgi:hypothetical protein